MRDRVGPLATSNRAILEPEGTRPKIILVAVLHGDHELIALPEGQICGEIDIPVDLGCIPARSRNGLLFSELVNDDLDNLSDPAS